MRYKKYILILLLVIFVGLNKVEATDCYYIGENFKAEKSLGSERVIINSYFGKIDSAKSNIRNWGKKDYVYSDDGGKETIPAYNDKQCPKYLYLVYIPQSVESYFVYAANDDDTLNTIKNIFPGYYGYSQVTFGSYLHADGTPITVEEYYGGEIELPLVPGTNDCQVQYDICIKIFPTNTSNKCLEDYKKCIDEQCDDIFGDKNVPGDLAYLINKVMTYIRYIVPVLIILLGTLDMIKAVAASKEDEMKKAQRTLIKRVIIGIAIFLLPILINAIMSLADIIWENYGSCGIDNIIN